MLCDYQAVGSDDLSIKTLINPSLVHDSLAAVEKIPNVVRFQPSSSPFLGDPVRNPG
jgi:hypothetical protein